MPEGCTCAYRNQGARATGVDEKLATDSLSQGVSRNGAHRVQNRHRRSGVRAYVVCGERRLIANIQPAAADDGMCPTRETLIGNLETTLFAVAGGRRGRESDQVVLAQYIKVAVRIGQTPLSDASIPPLRLTGRE